MKNKYTNNIWLLMYPLIGSNILQQLYNTIDSIIVSHFTNEQNFAAIGIASAVMNLFLFLVIGACTGISVIFSQSYGKNDIDTLHRTFFQALLIGTLTSLILAGLGIGGLPMILSIIHVPNQLIPLTKTYLTVIFLALPLTYLYNICGALLRSVGHSRTVMVILLISVLVNTGLDLFMVAYCKQGIFGAALATALAQCLSAILCLWTIHHHYAWLLFTRKDCIFDRKIVYLVISMASVTALHQSGLYIGKLLVQSIVNDQGSMFIAGFTAATRIEGFANSFGDSGCAATSIFIAQSFGANQMKDMQQYYKSSLRSMMGLGLFCSLIMYFFAPNLCGLMTSGLTLKYATDYLQMISLFYFFCFTGNTLAGYFDGIGQVKIPFIGAIGHITLRILLSALLIHSLGLRAVGLASGIGWIFVNLFWILLRNLSSTDRYYIKISPFEKDPIDRRTPLQ